FHSALELVSGAWRLVHYFFVGVHALACLGFVIAWVARFCRLRYARIFVGWDKLAPPDTCQPVGRRGETPLIPPYKSPPSRRANVASGAYFAFVFNRFSRNRCKSPLQGFVMMSMSPSPSTSPITDS